MFITFAVIFRSKFCKMTAIIAKKAEICKQILLEYQKQRDTLDKEIEDLMEILEIELNYEKRLIHSDYTGPVPDDFLEKGNAESSKDYLNCKLVDENGFPLPDVNHPLVTESRGKVRSKRNDRIQLRSVFGVLWFYDLENKRSRDFEISKKHTRANLILSIKETE